MTEVNNTSLAKELIVLPKEIDFDNETRENLERKYRKAVKLMKCTSCMIASESKAEMYQHLAKQFKKLTGYKESEVFAKKCKKRAKLVREEITANAYNEALQRKDSAKNAEAYLEVQKDFEKLSGYQNSDELAIECRSISNRMKKTEIRNRLLKIIITGFCIAAAFFLMNAPVTKYLSANIMKATGHYYRAANMYKELGNYKDSKNNLADCRYRIGLSLAEDGSYKSALGAFIAAGDYKDSHEQKALMEQLVIQNSNVGDYVKIGKTYWKILCKEGNRALVIKKLALPAQAYNDNFTDVTWENSSLRSWLNTEYLQKTFSEQEQSRIMLSDVSNSDNAIYGTDGGNDTKDYLFLLSVDEAAKYQEVLPGVKSACWLRSPGNSQSSAAFLTVGKKVMSYGYEVSAKEMKIYPAMWFSVN